MSNIVKKKLIEWEKQDGEATAWKDVKTGEILHLDAQVDNSMMEEIKKLKIKVGDRESKIFTLVQKNEQLLQENDQLVQDKEEAVTWTQTLEKEYQKLFEKYKKLEHELRASEPVKEMKPAEKEEEGLEELLDKGEKIDSVKKSNIYENPFKDIVELFADGTWHSYKEILTLLKKYYVGTYSYLDILRRKYLSSIKKRYLIEKVRGSNQEYQVKIQPKKVIANVDHKRKPHVKMQRRTMAKI